MEKTKEKWEITIDVMLIIGKYFESNSDYVNVMRIAKRYHDLVSMYHFNPISECSLFENMETQYLYSEREKKKEGMHQYVYLYSKTYEQFEAKCTNEIFKVVELKSISSYWKYQEFPLPTEKKNCIVPEGVTSIGNSCFLGCSTLRNIQLPSTLISIGDNAFRRTNISTITIPEGVTSIGNYCFNGCSSLTSIELPSSLISIGYEAFRDTNISSITIPEGITRYECKVSLFIKNMLSKKGVECPNYYLDSDDIRRNEVSINDGQFDIPEGLTSIRNSCFLGCSTLRNIQLPSTLISIGANSFQNTCIHDITIPEGVTSIGNACFRGCILLKNVTLPSTLISIGDGAFSHTLLKYVVIPEGTTTIGNSCFGSCLNLTSITLPSTLINIGHEAFFNTGIKEIIIPKRVTSIGHRCFENCRVLTKVVKHQNVQIGIDAFKNTEILK